MARIVRPRGPLSHKPNCNCYPCSARRREEEARLIESRDGRETPEAEVIEVDLPDIHTHKSVIRENVGRWAAMRMVNPNITFSEAAKELQISSRTLTRYVNTGTKEGWLKFDDTIDRIEHEIVPRVLDNIVHFLRLKDRTVTIEAAKGTLFKPYQESKGISDAPQTILALKIETVDPANVKVVSGHVVGKPRVLTE